MPTTARLEGLSMIGMALSHYRVVDKLGAGGMGVVYRAEDTNLNRQIAIKVLSEMFSGDPRTHGTVRARGQSPGIAEPLQYRHDLQP